MDASPARSPIMPSPRSPKTENKIQLRPVDTKWFFSADDHMMAEYAKQNPERYVDLLSGMNQGVNEIYVPYHDYSLIRSYSIKLARWHPMQKNNARFQFSRNHTLP